jgi:hypothetical protein
MSSIANQKYRGTRPSLQSNFVELVVVDAVPGRHPFEYCHDLGSQGPPAIDLRLEPFRWKVDPFTFRRRAVKVGLVCRKRTHSKASSADAPDFSRCAPARANVGYSAKVRLTDGFRFALPPEALVDGRVNAISCDDRIELPVALIGE